MESDAKRWAAYLIMVLSFLTYLYLFSTYKNGNIISDQVSGETAKLLIERFSNLPGQREYFQQPQRHFDFPQQTTRSLRPYQYHLHPVRRLIRRHRCRQPGRAHSSKNLPLLHPKQPGYLCKTKSFLPTPAGHPPRRSASHQYPLPKHQRSRATHGRKNYGKS